MPRCPPKPLAYPFLGRRPCNPLSANPWQQVARASSGAAHFRASCDSYPREHAAAISDGQWIEQKVSGKQSRTIANATISTKTASVHVSNILTKLDVSTRTEAATLAHRLGLLATT